jgi:hypothetical protein
VDCRCTPQPIRTFTEGLRLSGARKCIPQKIHVRAKHYPRYAFEAAFEMAERDPGWTAIRMDRGHDMMLDKPEEVTTILRSCAGRYVPSKCNFVLGLE